MKTLITKMGVPPKIDLDSPVLPAEQQEMMLKAVEEVGAEWLAAMELAELLEHLPDALALWFWRWLGAGRDGRSIFAAGGTRSRSHVRTRTRAWTDPF